MDQPPIESSREGLVHAVKNLERIVESLNSHLKNPPDWWNQKGRLPAMISETQEEVQACNEALKTLRLKLKKWKPAQLNEAAPAKKKKDYGEGTCCVCNREFKLKKDGSLRGHNFHSETIIGYRNCTGQDFRPLETTNEDCIRAIEDLKRSCLRLEKSISSPDPDYDPDDNKRRSERNNIELQVKKRYIENCQRNYDLWSESNPVPLDPLRPVTEKPQEESEQIAKMNSQNTVTVEVGRPGCLGSLLLVVATPILAIFFLR